jgi:SPW repeat
MDDNELENQSKSSWLNVLLGIWVIVSPFVLNYRVPRVVWSDVVAGALVLVIALVRASTHQQGWSWINLVLGIWIIISPFVLGFLSEAEMWNNIALGIIIGAIALHNAYSKTALRA